MARMLFFRGLRVQPRRRYNRTVSFLRRHRLFTVLFALCSLLFMQLAVAGYSCPGPESRVQEVAAMAQAGMPCADSMSMALDDEQPNLCKAHCDPVQAGTGHDAVQVPALAADNGMLHAAALSIALPQRSAPQPSLLARTTAPPLAIRNCCFRL